MSPTIRIRTSGIVGSYLFRPVMVSTELILLGWNMRYLIVQQQDLDNGNVPQEPEMTESEKADTKDF